MQRRGYEQLDLILHVSTLIRPSGRMQLQLVAQYYISDLFQPSSDLQAGCNGVLTRGRSGSDEVSTLIRPSGRMQLLYHVFSFSGSSCFNPHPTFRPDATHGKPIFDQRRHRRFNPHPTFRPDATPRRSSPPTSASRFNPHPTFRPDATPGPGRLPQRPIPFQPSSDLQAGCNPLPTPLTAWTRKVFQPSSDLQAGCNFPTTYCNE